MYVQLIVNIAAKTTARTSFVQVGLSAYGPQRVTSDADWRAEQHITWEKKNGGSFYKKLGTNNIAESVFSSSKDGFHNGARSANPRMQVRRPVLCLICHNFFRDQ